MAAGLSTEVNVQPVLSVSPRAVGSGRRHPDQWQRLLDELSAAERRSLKVAIALQERLALGARMLRAFQTQIDRVETSIETIEEYESAVSDMRENAERTMQEAREQIETWTKKALDDLKQAASEYDSRSDDKVERRMFVLESHLIRLVRQVTALEESVAAASPAQSRGGSHPPVNGRDLGTRASGSV